MNLIDKTDKYGEENKDYQVFIGDHDLAVSRIIDGKSEVLFVYTFPEKELSVHKDFVLSYPILSGDKKHHIWKLKR